MIKTKVTIIGVESKTIKRPDGDREFAKIHFAYPISSVQGMACTSVYVQPDELKRLTVGESYDAVLEVTGYRITGICLI